MIKRREQILRYLPELQKAASRQAREKEIPSVDLNAARKIVVDHVHKYQRKIYGGLAIHFALLRRNQAGLYDSDEENDIDFYSPDPSEDIKAISMALLQVGYQNVSVVEAVHFGTIKIKIKTSEVADITYCWRYYYNKIPFCKTKDGLVYVAPSFQIIDTYNTFIDPLFGWYKIEKNVIRAALLEQFYLYNHRADFKQKFKTENKISGEIIDSLKSVLRDRLDVILLDVFAYNFFIEMSKAPHWKNCLIATDNFTAYSLNPMKTLKDILAVLNLKQYEIHSYRPFLDKYGDSVKLVVDGHPYITLYHANSCLPYKNCHQFQIGTYHVVLRMLYIRRFGSINKNSLSDYKKYSYMIQHLQIAREFWLKTHNKLGIEEHLFQELQVECLGKGFQSPLTVNTDRIISKKRFRFIPTLKSTEQSFKQYIYPNTSGRLYKIIDENGTARHVSQKQAEIISEIDDNHDRIPVENKLSLTKSSKTLENTT